MSKEEFKKFVKKNPSLIKHVSSQKTSWQKLYEIYELYGENTSIWDEYRKETRINTSFNEIFNTIKNIDLEKLQAGIENIQSTIALIQNFSPTNQNKYEPNQKYYHYND